MLDGDLRTWLESQADPLDQGLLNSEVLLPRLAASGVLGHGVPSKFGGIGGDVWDGVEAIAQVATFSLTAALVFWAQRSFIEYLLQSENVGLGQSLLPDLLAGRKAGATGLSNAVKFLAGIEQLQVAAQHQPSGWQLSGGLPWVTNLHKGGFNVAVAIELDGAPPIIAAVPSSLDGLKRSDDLQLIGLQSSNTAALTFENALLSEEWLIAADAGRYLSQVRPAFLGMQCGMAMGLARRSLMEVKALGLRTSLVLETDLRRLDAHLAQLEQALAHGLRAGRFTSEPVELFKLRIGLAQVASEAVQLELQALGGSAYLQGYERGFARRLRESAFVPVITPSVVQLRSQLLKHDEAMSCNASRDRA